MSNNKKSLLSSKKIAAVLVTLVGFSINAAEVPGFQPGAAHDGAVNLGRVQHPAITLEQIQGALCFSDDEDDEVSQKQKEITTLRGNILALREQLSGKKRVVKKATPPAAPRDFSVITLEDITGALVFEDDAEVIQRKNVVIAMLQDTKLRLEGALLKKEQFRKEQLEKQLGEERRAGVDAAFKTKYTTTHASPREEFPEESNFAYACLMVKYDAVVTGIEEQRAQEKHDELFETQRVQAELEKQRRLDAVAAAAALSAPATATLDPINFFDIVNEASAVYSAPASGDLASLPASGFVTPAPTPSYNPLASVVATQRQDGDGGPTPNMTPGSAAALDTASFRAARAALAAVALPQAAAQGAPLLPTHSPVVIINRRTKKRVDTPVPSTPGSVVLAATAPIVATVAQQVVSSPVTASAPLTSKSVVVAGKPVPDGVDSKLWVLMTKNQQDKWSSLSPKKQGNALRDARKAAARA